MFTVGKVCIKIAGRDAGKKCVVVEEAKDGYVVIDGQTRRKRCNVRHLEPTNELINLKAGASHDAVKIAFTKLNIEIKDTKAKKSTDRPRKSKAKKVYEEVPEKKVTASKAKPAEPKVVDVPKVEEKAGSTSAPKSVPAAPKTEKPKAE